MGAKLIETIQTGDILGEGPLWSPRERRLWWTDIHGRRLRCLDPATGSIRDVPTPERVGSFALVQDRPGLVLAAFETGLALFDLETGVVDWLGRPEAGGTGRRFNDGRTDRQGRFWAGAMVEDEGRAPAGSAALWRVEGRGPPVVCETGVQISNGLCASPDGRTLYFADSPRRQIHAYDLDPATGGLSGKRLFAEVERGYPDGAAVDAQGCVWSARWAAGEVVRHAPDGRVMEVVEVPASQPTCVAFGGDDLSLLFVTSAADGLSAAALAADPSAGALFIYETDATGLPEVEFRLSPPAQT